MWHALSVELLYFRRFMVGAALIALAAAGMVNLLVWSGAGEGPPAFIASGLPSLGMIIGAMVVGFIAQGTRSEERRMRLLLAGQPSLQTLLPCPWYRTKMSQFLRPPQARRWPMSILG